MLSNLDGLLFELVKKIVFAAVSKRVVYAAENFFMRRKIESRLQDSIAQVVECLLPFFQSEHISDHKTEVLFSNLECEFGRVLNEPQELFAASLDGQKVFDRLYDKEQLPQGIKDEGLDDLYARVFPQIANLVCAYPPAVEQWKIEGYRDEFRRLDEIAASLGNLAGMLDSLTSTSIKTSDNLRARVAQTLIQRVTFQLDLVGLRGDRPDAVPMEKCFVVPELSREVKKSKSKEMKTICIGSEADISSAFADGCVRACVIGAPGSGKSTWSQWLQRIVLTNSSQRLAFVVRLRDIVRNEAFQTFQDLIRDAVGTHLREEVDSSAVRGWCEAGAITFILDGFDEVPTDSRDSIMEWIYQLDIAVENAGLVLTSRPLTTNHLGALPKKWVRWEMLPFNEPRITEYIGKWYAHAPVLADRSREVDPPALAAQWVKDPAIHPLVGTPLMLATILMVHHMDGRLPGGRSKLYERYINGMLGLWDSRWGVPSSITLEHELKKRLMTRLALELHLREVEQLGDAEIQTIVAEILKQMGCSHAPSTVLDYLRERSGLLIGPGTWSFVHKNVGEFLVAAAICDGDQVDPSGEKLDRMRLFRERQNDRWNIVLFFWAGLAPPGDLQSFIEQVLEEPGDKEFALAIGLFYDQLQPHRLTEPWKSQALLTLFRRGIDATSKWGVIAYPGAHPKELESDGSLPTVSSRGFQRVGFLECLEACIEASTISPEQASSAHESIVFAVWLSLLRNPATVDALRSALSREPWESLLGTRHWLFGLGWGVTPSAYVERTVSFDQCFEVVRECLPEHLGKIIFILLGRFLDIISQHHTTSSRPDEISRLFQCITMCPAREVDLEWLKLSDNFETNFFSSPSSSPDLLSLFLESFDQGMAEGLFSPDATAAEVRNIVTSMQSLRETLT